jgi:HKD family nuclease
MKILATAQQINNELVRLIEECSACQVAVAWASVGFEAFDLLTANPTKINRMVVGTHFFQTHPKFIETFLTHPGVRFVLNTEGVFHPKAYLFEKAGAEWECVIGSPNFTRSGVGSNDEMAVLVSANDQGAAQALADVKSAIETYWHSAAPISQDEFLAYREAWKRKRPVLANLKGKFGNPHKENADDHGKNPLKVAVLLITWADYFNKVKGEKTTSWGHSMEGRLKVIELAQTLFTQHPHFSDIEPIGRQKIAGLVPSTSDDPIDYRWFGSMKGAGKFYQAINNNDENLSLALDAIPLTGTVSRDMYQEYIQRYRKAFPEDRDGIGTASRLLAMKRPDTFVCFDARNRDGLCEAFGISKNLGYDDYWDSIIARVMEATWWCSPPPQAATERAVWAARVAFLDSLYYDGADMAGA